MSLYNNRWQHYYDLKHFYVLTLHSFKSNELEFITIFTARAHVRTQSQRRLLKSMSMYQSFRLSLHLLCRTFCKLFSFLVIERLLAGNYDTLVYTICHTENKNVLPYDLYFCFIFYCNWNTFGNYKSNHRFIQIKVRNIIEKNKQSAESESFIALNLKTKQNFRWDENGQ